MTIAHFSSALSILTDSSPLRFQKRDIPHPYPELPLGIEPSTFCGLSTLQLQPCSDQAFKLQGIPGPSAATSFCLSLSHPSESIRASPDGQMGTGKGKWGERLQGHTGVNLSMCACVCMQLPGLIHSCCSQTWHEDHSRSASGKTGSPALLGIPNKRNL